jgi:hypothetical protein
MKVVLNSLSRMMPSTRITRCFGVLAQSSSPDAFSADPGLFLASCVNAVQHISGVKIAHGTYVMGSSPHKL